MDFTEKETISIKTLEYTSAQEMLRHYDSLNWHIGSILIAATIILTGLAINKDFLDLLRAKSAATWLVTFAIPLFSFFILSVWILWFRRHRQYYNLRNEALHRLEVELKMYHFLRVVEADMGFEAFDVEKIGEDGTTTTQNRLRDAKEAAGRFEPYYKIDPLARPSGYTLAKVLTFGIPAIQFIIFVVLKLSL